MKQRNRINLFIIVCVLLGALIIPLTAHCQQGMKGSYTTKKVVTEKSLTKDAQVFDTFQETGVNVYYKQNKKKDGSVEDYYFIVVEKLRKNGEKYLTRQRIYPVFSYNK